MYICARMRNMLCNVPTSTCHVGCIITSYPVGHLFLAGLHAQHPQLTVNHKRAVVYETEVGTLSASSSKSGTAQHIQQILFGEVKSCLSVVT